LKKNNAEINGGHFWLAAESGYLFKSGNKSEWEKLTKVENTAWINQVRKIMSGYTENIDGSFIEER
jgi:trehalose-6-phosphatase